MVTESFVSSLNLIGPVGPGVSENDNGGKCHTVKIKLNNRTLTEQLKSLEDDIDYLILILY